MIVHMSFQSLNLAKNHCIKISQKSTIVKQFEGKTLPDDLFLYGDALIDFDSSGCDKSLVGNNLNSDTGFLLNMTVTGIYIFLIFHGIFCANDCTLLMHCTIDTYY